jgi:predicted O-linked N-acetylglucosamine transferase (SPINDLY family)
MGSDFRGDHPTAYLITGLVEQLARAPDVEVYIYPTQPPALKCPLIADLFRRLPTQRIRDISSMGVVERCTLILSDRLDVLLDVCGHTYCSTPSLIRALHGAEGGPWVVSYLADPGSPCDGRTAQLVDCETFHTEGMCSGGPVARLPPGVSYQPAPHALFVGEGILDEVRLQSAAEMGLPDLQLDGSWTVFLCPNRAARHGRTAWGLVSEIVTQHEKGYLLLVDQGCIWSSERLVSEAKAAGLPEGQARIWPSQARDLHFRRLAWLRRMELDGKLRVVVLVNAVGYPCHTQLGDCLALGFCVVAMCAHTDPAFHRRVTRSIFAAAGLLEFVADDEVQYKRIAADFAADGHRRKAYARKLGRFPAAADPVNPFFDIRKSSQHFLALMYTLKGVRGSQLPKVIDVSEEAARLAAAQFAAVV